MKVPWWYIKFVLFINLLSIFIEKNYSIVFEAPHGNSQVVPSFSGYTTGFMYNTWQNTESFCFVKWE